MSEVAANQAPVPEGFDPIAEHGPSERVLAEGVRYTHEPDYEGVLRGMRAAKDGVVGETDTTAATTELAVPGTGGVEDTPIDNTTSVPALESDEIAVRLGSDGQPIISEGIVDKPRVQGPEDDMIAHPTPK